MDVTRRLGIGLTGAAATFTAFSASFYTLFVSVESCAGAGWLCHSDAAGVLSFAVALIPITVILIGTGVALVWNRWQPLAITAAAALGVLVIVGVGFALSP